MKIYSVLLLATSFDNLLNEIERGSSSIFNLVVSIITMICGCILTCTVVIKDTLRKVHNDKNHCDADTELSENDSCPNDDITDSSDDNPDNKGGTYIN